MSVRPIRAVASPTLPWLALLVVLLGGHGMPAARADEPLIENGGLEQWREGAPVGWTIETGAHTAPLTPDAPANEIARLPGGGLSSTGSAETVRWNLVKQRFVARPGETFRIGWEARGVALEREEGQFDNVWIGAFFKDGTGARIGFPTAHIHGTTWTRDFLHVTAPPRTAFGELAIFCSTSGRLEVRAVTLERREPAESLDVLVGEMDRRYPFFASHAVDWPALVARHRAAIEGADSVTRFVITLSDLLAELRDGHVWISMPEGRPVVPHNVVPEVHFDLERVRAHVPSLKGVMRNVVVGRTEDGIGYVAVGGMQGSDAQRDQLDRAWRGLFDAKAIVLDLRVNGGGREAWAQHLMGCLVDETLLYARSRRRAGPAHDDFRDGPPRRVTPRPEARYRGPVVVLIGPGCASSGEAMAMMAKAMPDVTLLGQATRGSSGNPAPLVLPNGITVWYSRWISLFPDGTPLERHGVKPDVPVEEGAGEGDPVLEKALQRLRAEMERGER